MANAVRLTALARVDVDWLLTGREPAARPCATTSDADTAATPTQDDRAALPLPQLLDALPQRLVGADPAGREELGHLVLRYLDHPEARADIVRVIEELLADDPPA